MSRAAALARTGALALVLLVSLHWCLDGWLQSIETRLWLYQSMPPIQP